MAPRRLAALAVPVDLNRASLAELASLDGIGPKLAQRIVSARPFDSIDALAKVRGIGARRLAALRPRLVVGQRPWSVSEVAEDPSSTGLRSLPGLE
jgi:predicted DNA-binding helix-hairpin-helix protein